MNHGTQIEQILRRDRAIVALGLSGVTVIAWLYMFNMTGGVVSLDQGTQLSSGPHMHAWNPLNLILIFSMWAVMMIAMMVPSESPIVLMFAAINRERHRQQQPFVSAGTFLMGYVAAWTMFSALATLTQWALHAATLLSHTMVISRSIAGGTLLFAAGIFQWTPLKYACLSRCRSPLGFLMTEWREGILGAFIMGLKRGIYCIGCCWLLMGLMFVAGVMNLLLMVIIAIFVFLEKVVPGGFWISRIGGLLLIVWGLWMALGHVY